ncbi:hypothetical protein M8C21_006006 [Ambrosia artemisiifolia]|uniref:Serine hydrolase domain-containing protein n=1 Tax=Ambrosia artemisiifolia TaxID=4212 RepID=A0AAD5C3R8_AMBAR|nr:hypothetical protein M8C21_006006 [Ambrosia artemisiifolia]
MGGVTSSIAAKFAFFPPSPPSYTVEDDGGGRLVIPQVVQRREGVEVLKVRTKRGNEVVVVYIKHVKANATVLYSHGNAADLATRLRTWACLRVGYPTAVNAHKCSHCATCRHKNYDYSGYGQSTGKPSECNTYADVDAVYKCLKEKYDVKDDQLILYGQSVGSGPTIDLASRLPDLRGVVLHSPILSGLRVLHPVKRTYWFDIYKNIEKIGLVNCPVLVIHGTSDEVVDHSHGKQLWELCKNKYEPLWLKGGGHCNLEFYPEFIRHLKKFVLALGKSKLSTNGSKDPTPAVENQKKPSETETTGPADTFELRPDLPEVARNSLDSRLEKSKKPNKPEKSRMSVDIFRRRKGLAW